MDVSGTSAIVTGGASGLREATARALTGAGARIVILDRQADQGAAVAADIGGVFAEADVSDEAQVQAAVDAAVEQAPLRTLVNCAGLGGPARIVDRGSTRYRWRSSSSWSESTSSAATTVLDSQRRR